MLHSQYFQRRTSANNSALVPTGCQKIPKCYCLRIQPAYPGNGPVPGLYPGQYPLTIHRGVSGDLIQVQDSEVLYFSKGLSGGRGGALVAWVASLPIGAVADAWVMTWGDEPGDYIDPQITGAVFGPNAVNTLVALGQQGTNPVLIGGLKDPNAALMLEMLGFYGDKGAARVARKGEVLFDSTLLPGGALLDSGLLDLQGVDAVEVHADNVAGAVFRDLTMDLANEAGVTLETILLRKVAWGAAANGAQYAPGRVRGLISENPPGGTSGVHLLYDVTSPANTALDTGPLVTEDAEQVFAGGLASAGTTTITSYELDDASVAIAANNPTAASLYAFAAWGHGAGLPTNPAGIGCAIAQPVPRRVKFATGAAGAGNTVRLRVYGRGRPPGTFAIQMAVPPKARFKLLAGGAADGRLIVVAR